MSVIAEPSAHVRDQGRAVRWLRSHIRVLAPLATLLLLVIFFSFTTQGSFFTTANLTNLLSQVAPLAALAIGNTFVILCSEIDLSVANVATMSTVILVAVMGGNNPTGGTTGLNWPEWAAIILAVGACTVAGLVNGLVTTLLGIPSFMVTLAMLEISIGIVTLVTQGQILYLKSSSFTNWLGSAYFHQIPVIAIAAAILLVIAYFVLGYTRFGRYIYMVGGNREATELSGIHTKRVITAALTISGFCAGIAGVLYLGRLGTAQPAGVGSDVLIYCIAAVVLGGSSLFGGEGGIANTVIGLLILGVLENGLDQVSINAYSKIMIYGIILMIALVINVMALKLGGSDTT
jgi:ribose transport system permease protein